MKKRTISLALFLVTLTACGQKHVSKSLISSVENSSFSLSSSEVFSSSASSNFEEKSKYDGYYDSLVSWQNSADLINQLHAISRKTYRPLTYTDPNYETNINADHSYYDYEYLDVYYSADDIFKNESNKGWQREHAFCASLMCGSLTADAVKHKGRATDFHNLFAAQASANGSRGNKNYGVANKMAGTYQDRTVDHLGKDGYSFDSAYFEPADKDKGRLARAIFYMAMMYNEDEEDTVNGITMKGLKIVEDRVNYVAGENGAFAIGNLSTLLKWNKDYPVDYLEMQHNISVYQDVYAKDGYAQGNRNPFVDYPNLVNYAFGSKMNDAGSLKDITATEDLLECQKDNEELSHYALKSAKRAYQPGSQISNGDYKVVKVLKNYEYQEINEGFAHSLTGHIFSDIDGENITATIEIENDTIDYNITLDPSGSCSTGEIGLSTAGINKNQPGVEQEVTFGGVDFIFNIEGTTYVQNISTGGITFGSNPNPLTKLTIKTKELVNVDAAYAKCFVGNASSYYYLTIKVGDATLLERTYINNKDVAKTYGTSKETALNGQLTYIFEGSTCLKINSIAFNEII